jgi:hypothetical protein
MQDSGGCCISWSDNNGRGKEMDEISPYLMYQAEIIAICIVSVFWAGTTVDDVFRGG